MTSTIQQELEEVLNRMAVDLAVKDEALFEAEKRATNQILKIIDKALIEKLEHLATSDPRWTHDALMDVLAELKSKDRGETREERHTRLTDHWEDIKTKEKK